ncbi:MAG TPA: hypothetical protein VD962_00540 [Rubricoccaceae bacterium]|nr:hypothetical protein [Rubricoccaceae bacterium]
MSPERRYTEEEMRAIFARAARRRSDPTDSAGLTLAELQEIGAESGISPDAIAAAAAELAVEPGERPTFLGSPTEVTRTRHLPGPVSDEAWRRMVGELRRTFGDDGAAGQIGSVREWTAVGRGLRRDLSTRFAVEPDPSGTGVQLVIRQSTREIARVFTLVSVFTAAMAALFAAMALLGVDPAEMWPSVFILLAMTLAFGGGTQIGLRQWARRQEGKFEALLDRMELLAREDQNRAAPVPAGAVPAGTAARLDLDALDEAPGAEAPKQARRRERT